jgi:hypothetical protein
MHLKLFENAWRRLPRESVANIIERDAELLCHGSQVQGGILHEVMQFSDIDTSDRLRQSTLRVRP